MASKQDLILAYRHLYRHLLQAVQYAKPARFVARDILRSSFRARPPATSSTSTFTSTTADDGHEKSRTAEEASTGAASTDLSSSPSMSLSSMNENKTFPGLDLEAVRRTKWFLKSAAQERGLEHRIVKNIIRVRGEELRKARVYNRYVADMSKTRLLRKNQESAKDHYEMTIAMLNQSMGLCLSSGRQ